ncbi:hypothetical protein HK105_205408 [Polyrhizophydium stewartii]|uniref:E3 ubiquitin-protein ligase CHIP n=1 Tax=Polyrhizophydium stewartii TaxID=2732419 RepID=A0ABR4N6F6_9FUNG
MEKGNIFFAQKLYDDAIREYTTAIIQNPTESVYFTNRALCYLRTSQFQRVVDDCRKAISLSSSSVKAYYFLGQALLELPEPNVNEALSSLRRAYELSLEQSATFSEDIARLIREAKKRKWEVSESRRRERDSKLYVHLRDLIEADRTRQAPSSRHAVKDDKDGSEREIIHYNHNERLLQLESLLEKAGDPGMITFEIMTDPVITPSGITYDRTEILKHLRAVGPFDPISREPLDESKLVPNLALKECIDEFLSKNGWAVDY